MSIDFNTYAANLKLSDVKLLLLKELWGSGNTFPKNWVKSSHLLKQSEQKYFDRRLRELRDSEGLDIETKHINGEHCWRINSATINQPINRTYLTAAQKKNLFAKANNCCAVCGKQTESGVRGLQADHKVPLTKGGGEEITNWQAMCNECNVVKRRMCQDCNLDCSTCGWAYPEITEKKLLISLPKNLYDQLKEKKHTDDDLQVLITKFLATQI